MKYNSLTSKGIMNTDISLEIHPHCTVIIGNNRTGKTKTYRLIKLALYGTREAGFHPSLYLSKDELLPSSDSGYVELSLQENGKECTVNREYPQDRVIFKGEDYRGLREFLNEIGLLPQLLNILLTTERTWIGTITYEPSLREDTLYVYKSRDKGLRDNLESIVKLAGEEVIRLNKEIGNLEEKKKKTEEGWVEAGIFSQEDLKTLNVDKIKSKLEEMEKIESIYKSNENAYYALDKLEELEETLLKDFSGYLQNLDISSEEKEDFSKKMKTYLATYEKIKERGGMKKIESELNFAKEEEKKLNAAKRIEHRKPEAKQIMVNYYEPVDTEPLTFEIPPEISDKYTYEQIEKAQVVSGYDKAREVTVKENIANLTKLIESFGYQTEDLKKGRMKLKETLRENLAEKRKKLEGLKILQRMQHDYIDTITKIGECKKLIESIEWKRPGIITYRETLGSEEDFLRDVMEAAVNYGNELYRFYGFNEVRVNLGKEGIYLTDVNDNPRTNPSGAERQVAGLAWILMIAKHFNLPVCLDEIDALLDPNNIEKTKELIKREKLKTQMVITTSREEFMDVGDYKYRMYLEDGISRVKTLV